MREVLVLNQPQTEPHRTPGIGKLERYRMQTARAIEGVFFEKAEVANPWDVLLGGESSKSEKMVAGMYLLSRFAPFLVKKNPERRYLSSQDKVPFDSKKYSLKENISFCGANDVIVLDSQDDSAPSFVLKVNQVSEFLGNEEDSFKIAREGRNEYERIAAAYRRISGFVAPESHLVIHSPKTGKPVAAVLQIFVGGNIRDIFRDFTKEELQELIRNNDAFFQQLNDFISITENNSFLIEDELDLAGNNNLAVIGDRGKERLTLLDPHFIPVCSRNSASKEKIKRRFNYLREICGPLPEPGALKVPSIS